MDDNKEILKSMLKNVIAGNDHEASEELHSYLIAKSKEVIGTGESELSQTSAE